VAEKTQAALDVSLSVIVCVGETLQERESERTAEVVETQLKAVITLLKEDDWRLVVLLHYMKCSFCYFKSNEQDFLYISILTCTLTAKW
jgi:hypothetical protein